MQNFLLLPGLPLECEVGNTAMAGIKYTVEKWWRHQSVLNMYNVVHLGNVVVHSIF